MKVHKAPEEGEHFTSVKLILAPNDERASGGEMFHSEKHGHKWQKPPQKHLCRQSRRTEEILQAAAFSEPKVRERVYSVYMTVESCRNSFSLAIFPSTTGEKTILKREATTSDSPLTSPLSDISTNLHDNLDQMRHNFKLLQQTQKLFHPSCQNQELTLVEIFKKTEKQFCFFRLKYQENLGSKGTQLKVSAPFPH